MTAEAEATRRLRAWQEAVLVLALVAFGGALRWTIAERSYPVRTMGDERYYVRTAQTISRANKHYFAGLGGPAYAWRPPAHSWLLSLVIDRQEPNDYRPLVRLQVLLGTAVVAASWLLGRALFAPATGLLAAAATAVSPALVSFSHYLWSESLFALLITLALALIALVQRRRGWLLAALAGLVLGAAALTRELALGVAVVGACWWWVTAGRGGRARATLLGAILLACTAAVVLPWSLRNQRILGRFVPIATVGWFATAEGNILDADDWLRGTSPDEEAYRQRYFEIPDELRRAGYARKFALRRIGEEQPTWIFKKLVRNTALLLSPDCFLFEKLRRGSYPDPDPDRVRLIVRATLAWYAAALLLGAAGLAVAGDLRRRSLAWMVLGSVWAVHVLANASPRFRVPWWPLVFVYASHLVLHPRLLLGAGKWRWVAAVAAAALFAGLLAPQALAELRGLL